MMNEARHQKFFAGSFCRFRECGQEGRNGASRSIGRGEMPGSGSAFDLGPLPNKLSSTVYATELRPKIIGNLSPVIHALDGTMLALLPHVGMLCTVFTPQRRLTKSIMGIQEQPQSKINSRSVITQR